MGAIEHDGGVELAVSDIKVETRLRRLNMETVSQIAASMAEQGQLQPIIVACKSPSRGFYILLAGRHRLQAAHRLGWKTVRAEIRGDLDADDALLIEIDENLMRGELSPAERAAHTAQRKAIYERRHPETKSGQSQALGMNRALGHDVAANLATWQFWQYPKTAISQKMRALGHPPNPSQWS